MFPESDCPVDETPAAGVRSRRGAMALALRSLPPGASPPAKPADALNLVDLLLGPGPVARVPADASAIEQLRLLCEA